MLIVSFCALCRGCFFIFAGVCRCLCFMLLWMTKLVVCKNIIPSGVREYPTALHSFLLLHQAVLLGCFYGGRPRPDIDFPYIVSSACQSCCVIENCRSIMGVFNAVAVDDYRSTTARSVSFIIWFKYFILVVKIWGGNTTVRHLSFAKRKV